MKTAEVVKEFLLIFVVTFIVVSIVSFLYSLIVHSEGCVDWAMAFRLGIIFGIIFPWMHYRDKKKSS